jgi:hypothetical protein
MIESIDVVTILRDLRSCTTTFNEHTIEGLRVLGVARAPKGDANDSDWFACAWFHVERNDGMFGKAEQFPVTGVCNHGTMMNLRDRLLLPDGEVDGTYNL